MLSGRIESNTGGVEISWSLNKTCYCEKMLHNSTHGIMFSDRLKMSKNVVGVPEIRLIRLAHRRDEFSTSVENRW